MKYSSLCSTKGITTNYPFIISKALTWPSGLATVSDMFTDVWASPKVISVAKFKALAPQCWTYYLLPKHMLSVCARTCTHVCMRAGRHSPESYTKEEFLNVFFFLYYYIALWDGGRKQIWIIKNNAQFSPKHSMMPGFNCQLYATYNHLEESLSNRLSTSTWPRGNILIKLIDVGRPSPLWAVTLPKQSLLNCRRVEKSNWAQPASKHIRFSALLTGDVMWLPVSSSCCCV